MLFQSAEKHVQAVGRAAHNLAIQNLTTKLVENTAAIPMHPARLERATFGSVDRCSIQLSYGCRAT